MHLLITRPEPDASAWRAHLAARGIAASVDPLLEIEHLAQGPFDTGGVQALIATSRNGLRGLRASPDLPRLAALPVFTVGPGTADLARNLGFANVHPGPASARELVPVLAALADPGGGRLLHLTGDKLAFDLAAALAPLGFTVERRIVYRSRPAGALAPATQAALASGAIDTVMLMSPLSAKTFGDLVTGAGLAQQCQRLVYVCLSKPIAGILQALNPVHVHVAERPNSDDMLELIEELAERSGRRLP